MTAWSHRRSRFWILLGMVLVLPGVQACGDGEKREEKAAAPRALGEEAAISGTITLDPSLQEKVPKGPLLLIVASKSPDPNKPAITVMRVPGATFPYQYKLTTENISLVGSTFEGKMYVTARLDPAGMVGAARPGTPEGAYSGNPVAVGSTKVDIMIMSPSKASVPVGAGVPPAVPPGSKIPRIGLLWSGSTPLDAWSVPEPVRHGFRELGYVEGQNIVFEPRYAEARYDRLPALAGELVRLKVDIILAAGDSAAVEAAKNATETIPIVMMALADTVQLGLVASLARPGGNITGLSFPFAELAAKQLELVKQSIPAVSRVAVLSNPANPGHGPVLREIDVAARSLGLQLQRLEARAPTDLEGAFSAMSKGRADAVLVLWDPMLYAHGGRVVWLALNSRLPAFSTFRQFVEAGGLMAYGPHPADIFRGGASYVDKILRGAKPADLPVEQPTKFELVINLTTAKALGLSIPQSVLLRADKVIE